MLTTIIGDPDALVASLRAYAEFYCVWRVLELWPHEGIEAQAGDLTACAHDGMVQR